MDFTRDKRRMSSPFSLTRRRLLASGSLIAASGIVGIANASPQAFPARTVRIVVPYSPGGGTDLIARTLADIMAKDLGQTVIVENKPGGGTVIGSDLVARSAPDGYTLLMNSAAHAINASLLPKLPYSTESAFAPVALIGSAPNILVTRPDRPYKSLNDVLAAAKANPGKLTYGSAGNGSTVHLSGELLKILAKVDLTHVPYKGGGPAITDLLGGQIDFVFATAASVGPMIAANRLRAIAVTSARRSPVWPDVPTIAEFGIPGYVADVWYALFAPAGTPSDVIQRLNGAVKRAAQSDIFRKRVESEGLVTTVGTPENLAHTVREEIARWRKVVQEGRITVD